MSIVKKEKILEADERLGEEELARSSEQVGIKKKRIIVPEYCPLCKAGTVNVSYKDVYILKKFTSRRGRIIPRSRSGLCARHQRRVAKGIKIARIMALLPFVNEDE